jgi:hypothetical protein
MNLCEPSTRRSHLKIQVPDDYDGSLLVKIDIFPKDVPFQVNDAKGIFGLIPGYSPNYNVLLGFKMVNQIVDPTILFPTDPRLVL